MSVGFFTLLPLFSSFETVAQRRSIASLSEFGLSHVCEYAPFGLILSALHLILRAKSQHICFKCARMALRATFSYMVLGTRAFMCFCR